MHANWHKVYPYDSIKKNGIKICLCLIIFKDTKFLIITVEKLTVECRYKFLETKPISKHISFLLEIFPDYSASKINKEISYKILLLNELKIKLGQY